MSVKKIGALFVMAAVSLSAFAQEKFNPLSFVSFKKNFATNKTKQL